MEEKCTGSYSIKVIANWFLHKESMTHKKLQKLCYYAEAWHQALYDSTLYKGSHFEAWVHGPVCPWLYEKYKDCGWNDIPKRAKKPDLDKETEEFLEIVYNTYGHLSGHQLETLSHNEKPWQEARKGLGECEPSNNVIKAEIMKEFYNSIREETQND